MYRVPLIPTDVCSKASRLYCYVVVTLGSRLVDLNCLLSVDIPEIGSHIEFDLCCICAVRHHDGRIAYAASAKLHFFFCLDFTVFDKS